MDQSQKLNNLPSETYLSTSLIDERKREYIIRNQIIHCHICLVRLGFTHYSVKLYIYIKNRLYYIQVRSSTCIM